MKIEIKIDTSKLKARTLRESKRLAYGVADAINKATADTQADVRVSMDRTFTVRRNQFLYRLIKITQFATVSKNIPYAILAVDNTKARVLLGLFEDGGDRLPFVGKHVAVPITGTPVRPSFTSPVADAFTFQKLGFHKMAPTRNARRLKELGKHGFAKVKLGGSAFIWQGAERTFILPGTAKHPDGGVYQRVGPGKSDIRIIYSFSTHEKVKAVLKFVQTAQQKFPAHFAERFKQTYQPE